MCQEGGKPSEQQTPTEAQAEAERYPNDGDPERDESKKRMRSISVIPRAVLPDESQEHVDVGDTSGNERTDPQGWGRLGARDLLHDGCLRE